MNAFADSGGSTLSLWLKIIAYVGHLYGGSFYQWSLSIMSNGQFLRGAREALRMPYRCQRLLSAEHYLAIRNHVPLLLKTLARQNTMMLSLADSSRFRRFV